MKRTRLTFKSRDEWLAQRMHGIGASEVAAVVGLSPWETPYQLWRRKLGLDPPLEENSAMKLGHYLEDAVARLWSDATGLSVIKSSSSDFMFVNKEYPHIQVSPDRTYWLGGKHNDDNKGILECKTTQLDIDPDNLPKHWFVQLQTNLGVSGLEHGSIAWLSHGRDFGYKDVEFVPDFFDWLVEQVDCFWNENILHRVEPAFYDDADTEMKFPKEVPGVSVVADEDILATVSHLRVVNEQIKVLTSQKEEDEGKIKMAIGSAEGLTTEDGKVLATWKASKDSEKFDEKLFASENPKMYDKYLVKKAGTRRFSLKK